MNIKEFAAKYCSDIIQRAKQNSELFSLKGFPYDDIIIEEDGTKVPVIVTANYQVPVADILGMSRDDFAKVWPYPDCLEAYDLYVGNLIIIEGEEALMSIRNELNREQDKISAYSLIPDDF